MARKRDRLQVIHDILKVIQEKNGKIKPTHILYKSNLSHQMMEEYLGELIEKDFIIENKEKKGKTYSLTKKGFEYLQKYKFIIEFSDSFGLT
jgi:predicted transcriptional regulator